MLTRLHSMLGRFDWLLFFAVTLLVVVGIASIWSVALSRDGANLITVKKQLVAGAVGLAIIFFLVLYNYRQLKNYSLLISILTVVLLVLVLFFGRTVRGTTGWFWVAGWNFQPVELAKFALIIFLARYLSDHPRAAFGRREFVLSSVAVLLVIGLVLAQPDLGSAAILATLWFGLLLFARVRLRYPLTLIAGALLAFVVAWFFILVPYQKDRLLTFFDSSRDPLGRGYNVRQAVIAVGSGELFGRGLGFGSQSQLRFLPESQTDFIFAVIAEQLGLVGVILVFGFYGLLFGRLFVLTKSATDDFSAFLSLGILLLFIIQFIINVGMNLGLMPVTGIALPFVSYGGSALLISLIMIGIVQSIAIRRPLVGRTP